MIDSLTLSHTILQEKRSRHGRCGVLFPCSSSGPMFPGRCSCLTACSLPATRTKPSQWNASTPTDRPNAVSQCERLSGNSKRLSPTFPVSTHVGWFVQAKVFSLVTKQAVLSSPEHRHNRLLSRLLRCSLCTRELHTLGPRRQSRHGCFLCLRRAEPLHLQMKFPGHVEKWRVWLFLQQD